MLILCTHNSARSVLAEAMLNHWAVKLGRDVCAHSAGSAPSGKVNSFALTVLGNAGINVAGVRSKSWDEFAGEAAPVMRVVITVCDAAAAERCPYWPGGPIKVHWGYPDPSNAAPTQMAQAFELTRQAIGFRMLQLLALPLERLSNTSLQDALNIISKN